MFRVENQQKVYRYTIVITAISVMAPLSVVGGILSLIPGLHPMAMVMALVIAGLIPLLIAPPVAYMTLNMFRLVTEMLDRVDAQVRFDPLTGVLNRGFLLDQIRAQQTGGALMIIDADHFKSINDNYGHSAGDSALVIIANAMAQTVGNVGLVGRLGGEEFAAFLPGVTPDRALEVGNAICANIRRLDPLIEGHRIKLRVSVGITMHPKTALIGKSLKLADDLLYRAKAEGRDRVVHDMMHGMGQNMQVTTVSAQV